MNADRGIVVIILLPAKIMFSQAVTLIFCCTLSISLSDISTGRTFCGQCPLPLIHKTPWLPLPVHRVDNLERFRSVFPVAASNRHYHNWPMFGKNEDDREEKKKVQKGDSEERWGTRFPFAFRPNDEPETTDRNFQRKIIERDIDVAVHSFRTEQKKIKLFS